LAVAHFVQHGRFDLGWIPSRTWDELGVQSFRALQAPFLITSYRLLDRVIRSPIRTEMLRGLGAADVAGIQLIPGELRHPLGLRRPLVRYSDYLGKRIDVPLSRTTDALVRSLGAKPLHLNSANGFKAYSAGRVDGKEYGYLDEFGPIVTANVTFFPTAWTLFMNENVLTELDRSRREAVRLAARETLEHSAVSQPTEDALLAAFCREGGRAVTATEGEQAELARAAEPVLASLARDPQTAMLIRQIRLLKHELAPGPSVHVLPRCRGAG
jgi:TRAP-type C4-dicarboxylate transport system substrate-binding protein